jgi:hypothetical protein
MSDNRSRESEPWDVEEGLFGTKTTRRVIVPLPAARSYEEPINLNEVGLGDAGGLPDPGQSFSDVLQVVMRDQLQHVCEFIRQYPCIVGCVAWLTHERVVGALATRKRVSLVVQKEDFLREAGAGYSGQFRTRLRAGYGSLRCGLTIDQLVPDTQPPPAGDARVGAVRCFGLGRTQAQERRPVMHHKFLVGGEFSDEREPKVAFDAQAVWTGSFNPSLNGDRSIDNSVILRHPNFAHVYAREWLALLVRSEPLNWESNEPLSQWWPPDDDGWDG